MPTPDFFAESPAPKTGHRWAELLRGPSWLAGTWTCVKGKSYGERYSHTGISDQDREAFKNQDALVAHAQMFGCNDFTETTDS